MRWAVIDSLYCAEQFFCSHLDSYSHYLTEAGEDVQPVCLNIAPPGYDSRDDCWHPEWREFTRLNDRDLNVALFLDGYDRWCRAVVDKRIAQVAAICSPMPWEVRKPDGSPAFDLVLSSIPAMVDRAEEAGCRAEYMPLAFDLRARACMMGVKREKKAIFLGTRSPNHRRREQWLTELADIVEIVPPVFGRDMFKTLASARVVLNVHAEWSKGAANNMRLFESCGLGAAVVSDGAAPARNAFDEWPVSFHLECDTVARARELIESCLHGPQPADWGEEEVLAHHTYECADRVPRLIQLAKEL